MALENPFRPEYRELKPTEKAMVDNVKVKAFELLKLYPVGTRETSLAITHLETSVMWSVKSITG